MLFREVWILWYLYIWDLTTSMAYSRELYYGFNTVRRSHCKIGACLGQVLKAPALQLHFCRLASARFYWRPGTFISRESIHTHTSECIASDPRLFSRYREEADARIINRVCRNNRCSRFTNYMERMFTCNFLKIRMRHWYN